MRILGADIGGTKTLLQTADLVNGHWVRGAASEFASQDHQDFATILALFLDQVTDKSRSIHCACIAIAGPVTTNGERQTANVTNLPWQLDNHVLARRFGIKKVLFINDFQAVGASVETLSPSDIIEIQTGLAEEGGVRAVIGAGTGLGQAFMVKHSRGYRVYGTEGGHTDFAPTDATQHALLQFLQARFGHVSYERLVSGPGLCNIYEFMVNQTPTSSANGLLKKAKTGDAAAIASAAKHGDQLALATIRLFFKIYGAQAGNLALSTLPRGGLYIAGGIAVKLPDYLREGGFLDAFHDKGRMQSLLQSIPIRLINNPQMGLIGALYTAQNPNE